MLLPLHNLAKPTDIIRPKPKVGIKFTIEPRLKPNETLCEWSFNLNNLIIKNLKRRIRNVNFLTSFPLSHFFSYTTHNYLARTKNYLSLIKPLKIASKLLVIVPIKLCSNVSFPYVHFILHYPNNSFLRVGWEMKDLLLFRLTVAILVLAWISGQREQN